MEISLLIKYAADAWLILLGIFFTVYGSNVFSRWIGLACLSLGMVNLYMQIAQI